MNLSFFLSFQGEDVDRSKRSDVFLAILDQLVPALS